MKKKSYLLFLLYFYASCLLSVKIDRVILSTNNNPCYLDFWPMIAKAWNQMGVKPTLALIGDQDLKIDESLGDIVRFEPINNISTAYHAQVIRLLLPCYFEDDVCLISDIDMLPLNKDYLLGTVDEFSDDKFVVYSTYMDKFRTSHGIIPLCYTAAKGKIYKEIFQISELSDIKKTIQYWYKLSATLKAPEEIDDKAKWTRKMIWSTDERMLTAYLKIWKKKDGCLIKLGNTFERTIDRNNWKYDIELLKNGYYRDAHLPKPISDPDNKNKINTLLKHAELQNLIQS
jgi:hypothetical protein